jgi:Spy/CpxP family protein refolding chaperone
MFAGAAALSVAALAVSAAPGPGRGGERGGHHRGRGGLMEDARLLDLSDEQSAAVKDLYRQHHEAVRPLVERERELFQKLREAASQDGADPAKVGQIAIDAHKVGEQLRGERRKMEDAFVNLLTPEQKEMWSTMRASREKERERRREEWSERKRDRS